MSRSRAASEAELRTQLERITHRTTAISSLVEQYTAPLDTPTWLLLRLIEWHAPVRATDLAAHSRLSRPTVSRCLAALVQSDYVAAEPDPRDGRAALLRLTATGQRQLDHAATVGQQRIHEVTEGFTADEVETLARLLTRLNDNADAVADTPSRYRLEQSVSACPNGAKP